MIESLIQGKKTCYFVSPHLDDALFSAGGLISYLKDKIDVRVISVFTRPSSPPETIWAKRYVRSCGFCNADLLFDRRKEEDRRAMARLGIASLYLGYIDACWRKKGKGPFTFLSSLIPELCHIYPIRAFARNGCIHDDDLPLVKMVRQELLSLISEDDSIVFCPLGTGKHVDHIIVHKACENAFSQVIYWSDYPYNLTISDRNRKMGTFVWTKNKNIKKNLIMEYKTQLQPLFKGKRIKIVPEVFYSHLFPSGKVVNNL